MCLCIYIHTYVHLHVHVFTLCMKKCNHPHTQKIYSQEVVLSGVDFRHVNISAIVMECDGPTKELLQDQGYVWHQLLRNCRCHQYPARAGRR